jgi:CubicO group peptidase (beta-lactamase class C family)
MRGVAAGLLAVLIGSTTAAQGLSAQEGSDQGRTLQERVDAVFASMDDTRSPGCAVSAMEEGELVLSRGYGMANLEYGIPIAPSSIFHVASVSKQFTAFAVALLVAEGKVSWDDDIREYAPEVPDFGKRITLRHLANHTSGIRDQWSLLSMSGWRFEADVITQRDVLQVTSMQKALNFEPGDQYLYSNTGFTLLAVVVERVSGQTLNEFTQERIFGPLGMADTHFHDDHNTIVPNRAYAYAPMGDGEYRTSIPDFDVVGATSLHTTVEDLGRWDRNFYTGQVGGTRLLREMHRRGILNSGEEIGYALGLSHGSYRGLHTVGHSGSDAGYRSQFLRFPEEAVTVAVLCNFPSSNPGGLARSVADIYLEDAFPQVTTSPEEEPTDAAPISQEELERLAGLYLQPANPLPTRVLIRDGSLVVMTGGGVRLVHVGDLTFRISGSSDTVRFVMSDEGVRIPNGPGGATYRRMDPWYPGPESLAEYVDRYYAEELGIEYRLQMADERLLLETRKSEPAPLQPIFRDGFQYRGGSYLTFTRDAAGRVNGFTISSGRVWGVRFDRAGG